MTWTAYVKICGRGGTFQSTHIRREGVIPMTGFFYRFKRRFNVSQPAYYLVTWQGGQWTGMFRASFKKDGDLL